MAPPHDPRGSGFLSHDSNMADSAKRGVLMVCLGNICRSPIAEAVFQHEIEQRGLANSWFVDSAATADYHTGSQPDSRARATIKSHGIDYLHKARQLCDDDFSRFDWIFGMDDNNVRDIKREQPRGTKAKVEMLGNWDPEDQSIIVDPYYQRGSAGFELCFVRCTRAVKAFLDEHGSS